jgi:hypothetical protein
MTPDLTNAHKRRQLAQRYMTTVCIAINSQCFCFMQTAKARPCWRKVGVRFHSQPLSCKKRVVLRLSLAVARKHPLLHCTVATAVMSLFGCFDQSSANESAQPFCQLSAAITSMLFKITIALGVVSSHALHRYHEPAESSAAASPVVIVIASFSSS